MHADLGYQWIKMNQNIMKFPENVKIGVSHDQNHTQEVQNGWLEYIDKVHLSHFLFVTS